METGPRLQEWIHEKYGLNGVGNNVLIDRLVHDESNLGMVFNTSDVA